MINKIRDINIDYLEYIRKSKGIKQTDLSKALNKSDSYYTVKVNTEVKFSTQDLIGIINYLALDSEQILQLLGVNL